MNKLLKSILIATASIGAITASTAAVVSCSESSTQSADQLKYQSEAQHVISVLLSSQITIPTRDAGGDQNKIFDNIATLFNGEINYENDNYLKDISGSDIQGTLHLKTTGDHIRTDDISVKMEQSDEAKSKGVIAETFEFPIFYSVDEFN